MVEKEAGKGGDNESALVAALEAEIATCAERRERRSLENRGVDPDHCSRSFKNEEGWCKDCYHKNYLYPGRIKECKLSNEYPPGFFSNIMRNAYRD